MKNKTPLSTKVQNFLWKIGIAWHNNYRDECTIDFNCCCKNIGRKNWLRFKR